MRSLNKYLLVPAKRTARGSPTQPYSSFSLLLPHPLSPLLPALRPPEFPEFLVDRRDAQWVSLQQRSDFREGSGRDGVTRVVAQLGEAREEVVYPVADALKKKKTAVLLFSSSLRIPYGLVTASCDPVFGLT